MHLEIKIMQREFQLVDLEFQFVQQEDGQLIAKKNEEGKMYEVVDFEKKKNMKGVLVQCEEGKMQSRVPHIFSSKLQPALQLMLKELQAEVQLSEMHMKWQHAYQLVHFVCYLLQQETFQHVFERFKIYSINLTFQNYPSFRKKQLNVIGSEREKKVTDSEGEVEEELQEDGEEEPQIEQVVLTLFPSKDYKRVKIMKFKRKFSIVPVNALLDSRDANSSVSPNVLQENNSKLVEFMFMKIPILEGAIKATYMHCEKFQHCIHAHLIGRKLKVVHVSAIVKWCAGVTGRKKERRKYIDLLVVQPFCAIDEAKE